MSLSGGLVSGSPSSGTINGATALSTITSTLTGLTVNSAARTYSFDGSAAAGASGGLVETLAGATGSPKTTALTVNSASAIPPADWRMPATAATSSGLSGSASALSAAQANSASKSRPSVTIVSGGTEYVEWTVGETGTALLSFLPNGGLGTITVTKNGADLGFAPAFPAGGAATDRRQFVRTPVVIGDVLRLTCVAGGFNRILSPLLHKIPASGAYDAHLMFGASREQAQTCLSVETALVSAYPTRDPVLFNYALSGANSSELAALVASLVSTYSGAAFFCEIGSIIGNDVTGGRPYDSSELAPLNANVDAILNPIKAAFRVGFSNTSFRHYAGSVLPTNQAAGSAPYNDAIIHPKILEHAPHCYDTTYVRARNDEYLTLLYNRAALDADGVHGDYPDALANWVNYWFSYVYSGAWPTAKVDTVVALAEAAKTQAAVNEAQYAVDALVSSAGKTALQNRINSIVVSTLRTSQIGYGSSTAVAGWNNTAGG